VMGPSVMETSPALGEVKTTSRRRFVAAPKRWYLADSFPPTEPTLTCP
jgi:hypothetical protein